MSSLIIVQNALRIWEGNILLIPGSEPISVVTSVSNYEFNPFVKTLLSDPPASSYISLAKAKEVILGWSIKILGPNPAYRYFVLPDGPPPDSACPCGEVNDWYGIMRFYADGPGNFTPVDKPAKQPLGDICAGFNHSFCL